MTNLDLFLLAIVIASNNFSVALALGTMGQWRRVLRIVLVFGFFEFFIPLVGAFAGQFFSSFVQAYASYIGGSLLILLALYAFYGALLSNRKDREEWVRRSSTWTGLIGLAFGLSLDNMIVGLSLGFTEHSPWVVASVIAFSSIVFTIVGLRFGQFLKAQFVRNAQIAGSVLLLILGVATLMGWI